MEHIHKYKRFKFPKGALGFRCMLPNCSHYVFENMIVGRQSICWRCGECFTITEASGKLLKPHCNCIIRKKTTDSGLDLLAQKLIERAEENKRKEKLHEVIRLHEHDQQPVDGLDEG